MRFWFLLMLVLSNGILFGQIQTYSKKNDSDPKAKVTLDKLKKTMDGYSSVEMKFTLTIEASKQVPIIQKGTLIQSGNKYQLIMDQQEVYCDGKTTWMYYKKNKQVQVTDYDEAGSAFLSPKQVMNMYQTGNYVYAITEERTEKGNVFADIEFKPLDLNAEFSKMRLTVDKTQNKIVSLRVFSKDGSRYHLQLNSTTPNKKYDPAVFVFNVKANPGVRLEDLRID
ncbi:MAG: outer membrane lipoprotein carrier protein LolA [Saprospiraceae bacterium]